MIQTEHGKAMFLATSGSVTPAAELIKNALELKVCECLHTYNQLRSFKLDSLEIIEWKDTLLNKIPDLSPRKLDFAIDAMMDGQIPYDSHAGIQNIFKALSLVDDSREPYKVLKPIW